ncbi:unnamed protein product [Auanema sp. JU1783]|nr:unnamed protein product [Auanema sp. JU1783]
MKRQFQFITFVLMTVGSDVLAQLEIRACCGGLNIACQSFERVEDLFGVSCCGNEPYNTYSHLCCSGVVRERNRGGSYAELCCGTEVLRYDQTCCNGVVHNMINGDCCGQAVYSKLDKTYLCCNQTLARTITPSDVCCGSTVFDGGRTQICCGNQVSEKTNFDSCCEKNDKTLVPFKSSTHMCCNGAYQRSTMACCYLRINGTLVPSEYNPNNLCCKYPYERLTTKTPNQSCTD